MKTLIRFSELVFNTPQLADEKTFRLVTDYLIDRNTTFVLSPEDSTGVGTSVDEDEDNLKIAGRVGVLNVHGPLTYKPVQMLCAPDGVSYQGLIEDVASLIDLGVNTIVLDFASGGGEASHCFSSANQVRQMTTDAGVRLVSYIDQYAASAAYAWACIADEVIMHPDAQAGSIGAMIALMDTSKAMEKEGYKRIFISSPKGKIPYEEDGTFKQEFLDRLQAQTDKLNKQFVEFVSLHTGLSSEEIISLDAQVFDAEESLKLGLVNAIMDHTEFSEYILQP